ncbi:hypothetical protein BDAP_002753 [Binucleata daphniae]
MICKAIYKDDVKIDTKIDKSVIKEAERTLELLKPVVTSKCFSKIRINIDQPCKMKFLAKKCTYKKCVVPRDLEDEVKNYPCRVGKLNNNICIYKEINDPKAINVDLLKSQQINSGYTDGAAIIWQKMHEVVKEHDLFAKLLSGLHFSVTVHISQFYYEKKLITYNPIFYNSKRNNQHIKNLMFTQKYVKEAFGKINSKFIICSIENTTNDSILLNNLIKSHQKYTETDNETITHDNALKHYKKLLECTNCIDCDKCKLWGKIQIKGLFSAYKLQNGMYKQGEMPGEDLIYLVNTYNKLTESIVYANELDKIKCAYLYLFYVYSIEIVTFFVTLLIFFAFRNRKNKKNNAKKRLEKTKRIVQRKDTLNQI